MKQASVKEKKQRPTLTLVLSLLSLMVGLIWSFTCVTLLSANAAQIPMGRMLMLAGIAVLFLLLGARGILRWRSMMAAGGRKPGKAVVMILAVVAVMMVGQGAIILPGIWRNSRLDAVLGSYVRDSFSEENVPMPEDPRFVFYHNGHFSVPSSQYHRGTNDPNRVNVVVKYTEVVSENGIWVEKGTGKKVADARTQSVTLYVIRLEDWALIEQKRFSEQLDYDETGTNVIGMSDVQYYLNELFGEGDSMKVCW